MTAAQLVEKINMEFLLNTMFAPSKLLALLNFYFSHIRMLFLCLHNVILIDFCAN